MGISDRIARLEQLTAPTAPSTADRYAAVLNKARAQFGVMTPGEWDARQRKRHEEALAAPLPGPRASELARRLDAADRRVARDYFTR